MTYKTLYNKLLFLHLVTTNLPLVHLGVPIALSGIRNILIR